MGAPENETNATVEQDDARVCSRTGPELPGPQVGSLVRSRAIEAYGRIVEIYAVVRVEMDAGPHYDRGDVVMIQHKDLTLEQLAFEVLPKPSADASIDGALTPQPDMPGSPHKK